MKKLVYVSSLILLLLLSSCSFWESLTQQSETIVSAGEAATSAATAVAAFNPEIGLIVLTFGGLIIAVGETLKLFKRKE